MLACLASSPSPAASTLPSDNPGRSALDVAVDSAAHEFFRSRCHVGLSIAVRDANNSYFYNYGTVSRTKPQQPTSQSLYELASVTKTFTASLAAQAVAEGRMQLDHDFRDYLPGRYANLAWQGKPITLRSLLTHRSGMPRDIPNTDTIMAENNYATRPFRLLLLFKGFGRQQFVAALHEVKLRSAPGNEQAYSNAGYLVIALGLEHVYGKPYADLLQERITEPQGMVATGLNVSDRAQLVPAYDRYGRVMPYHPESAGAAWGLYATPQDMARYLRLQLDLRNAAVRASHQPLAGTAYDGEAMAWNLGHDSGQPMLWHGGGSFGMSSQVVLYPRQRQGFVLLANDACAGTEGALKNMAQAIHAQIDAAK
jgi:CubicO group peptidase (beta-lactamase class C family)